MHRLEYLPVALQDMTGIAEYIGGKLANPEAARRLITTMVDAAQGLCESPYAFPVYMPRKPPAHESRKLPVKHFLMFHWVDEPAGVVTVARAIYARRDCERLP